MITFPSLQSIPGRFKEWWFYKTPFILSVAYSAALLDGTIPSLTTIGLFLLSFIGCAMYGYMLNDWFDRQVDYLAGKKNQLSNYSNSKFGFIVLCSLALGITPWYFLPFNKLIYVILGIEFLLLTIYCLPPIRLKTRGLVAIITDSLYGFVLPFILAALLFIDTAVPLGAIISFVVFLLVVGIRNILAHQLQDYSNDQLANVATIATKTKSGVIKKIIEQVMLIVEISCLFTLCSILGGHFVWIIILFFAHAAFAYKRELKIAAENRWLLPAEYAFVNDIILNEFYQTWLPFFLLFILCGINSFCFILLALHAVLFFPQLKNILSDVSHLYFYIKKKSIKFYWKIRNNPRFQKYWWRIKTRFATDYYRFLRFGMRIKKMTLKVFGYTKK